MLHSIIASRCFTNLVLLCMRMRLDEQAMAEHVLCDMHQAHRFRVNFAAVPCLASLWWR